MTAPLDIAHRWTWTGDRNLPTWLDRHHHWHTDRPVIHTTDGPRTLYDGWLVALWTDGVITVGSATVADRVYGDNGIAGRLAAAEAALARVREAVHIADPDDATDWQRGYRACAERAHAALDTRPTATQATEAGGWLHAGTRDLAIPAPLTPNEEARLAQDGVDTPGCDCGHTGMGVSWHGDDCPWRRGVVDCPGRPTPA